MSRIQRALISVSDKSGIVELSRVLAEAGVEIISTGGTAQALRTAGVPVMELSEFTGFPEMLDGRVKTLHPMVHGGLLYLRGNTIHEATVEKHGIKPIDLVVVNLYPFESTIRKPDVSLAEAIENVDIGGPSMLRSAAKNHESVTVVVDPVDYLDVAEQVQMSGETTLDLRRRLAAKVFARTAAYDKAIADYLAGAFDYHAGNTMYIRKAAQAELPTALNITGERAQMLRYGENPHQRAALYGRFHEFFKQLHGKELSYNNILDLTAAANLICEFLSDAPTVAILKHTNPCGVGQGDSLREAWDHAYVTDKQAPFGGIIAVNQSVDAACAQAVAAMFSEVIVAPNFEPDALAILQQKKNLRLVRMQRNPRDLGDWEVRSVGAGSYLLQDVDQKSCTVSELRVVTQRQPTQTELSAMLFGWRVVKHVKSNAIVYAASGRTLGIGAGQMSRVDSSRIAVWKAKEAGVHLDGSAVCSDAFFPFPDGLIAAAEAGATAAIQPGGSVKDPDVIAAANQRNMTMIFTGTRHFRH